MAEAVPSAMVTYVALIMFDQFGARPCLSTLYVALLFLPRMLKTFVRAKVRGLGRYGMWVHIVEIGIFLCLILSALYIHYCRVRHVWLFAMMLVVAAFCAWHELVARMYYEHALHAREQGFYRATKFLSTQTAVVVTYGVLIIFVGLVEVYLRNVRLAWAMENYLVGGVFLLFLCANVFALRSRRGRRHAAHATLSGTVRMELRALDRIRQKPDAVRLLLLMFLLLLPQSLMFCTRVFFLLGPGDAGGLGCSLQEVGFAQGTVGVIAFSIGHLYGRSTARRGTGVRMLWTMAVLLTVSPTFYMLMAHCPEAGTLPVICVMTFMAQFCFGFGINLCLPFVRYFSGERYRNTINVLFIPLVVAAMLVPTAVSGWMATLLGFKLFFAIDAATALPAWIAMAHNWRRVVAVAQPHLRKI